VAQVFGEARRRGGAEPAGGRAAAEREHREEQQPETVAHDDVHAAALLDIGDESGREQRDDALAGHLAHHEQGGQDGGFFVFADALHESFDHG